MIKPLSVRLNKLLKSSFEHSSENLAKFARNKNYLKNHYRILKHKDDLYIGFVDDIGLLNGAKLLRVACGKFDTFAYTGMKDIEDVTEWFMQEYQDKGMCAYTDMRHEWDVVEMPDMKDGVIRTCIHCGEREVLQSKMVRKTWWDTCHD